MFVGAAPGFSCPALCLACSVFPLFSFLCVDSLCLLSTRDAFEDAGDARCCHRAVPAQRPSRCGSCSVLGGHGCGGSAGRCLALALHLGQGAGQVTRRHEKDGRLLAQHGQRRAREIRRSAPQKPRRSCSFEPRCASAH